MVNSKRKHEDNDVFNLEKKLKVYKDKISDFLVEKLDDKAKKSIDVLKELQFLFNVNSYCYYALNFAIGCYERNFYKINDAQYETEISEKRLDLLFFNEENLPSYNLKINFDYKIDAQNKLEEGCSISFSLIDSRNLSSKTIYSFYDYDVDDDKKPDARIDFINFYKKLIDEGILQNNLIS